MNLIEFNSHWICDSFSTCTTSRILVQKDLQKKYVWLQYPNMMEKILATFNFHFNKLSVLHIA